MGAKPSRTLFLKRAPFSCTNNWIKFYIDSRKSFFWIHSNFAMFFVLNLPSWRFHYEIKDHIIKFTIKHCVSNSVRCTCTSMRTVANAQKKKKKLLLWERRPSISYSTNNFMLRFWSLSLSNEDFKNVTWRYLLKKYESLHCNAPFEPGYGLCRRCDSRNENCNVKLFTDSER